MTEPMPPQPPLPPEIVTRTMFYQGGDKKWYWQTKAINNEIVGDGSEGYNALRDAIAGYFSQQGVPYGQFSEWPANYGPLQKLPDEKFQINKYLSTK